jgi:RimJ/RimL family protein N-acetyltransferase
MIQFRKAVIGDARLLLDWRNHPSTRSQFFNSSEVIWEDHVRWVEETLVSSSRNLYICETTAGTPVGTVRVDFKEDHCELSWTIGPEMRGKGYGKSMLSQFVETLSGEVRAQVKSSNIASLKMAGAAGFQRSFEKDEVVHFVLKKK